MAMLFKQTIIGNDSLPKQPKLAIFWQNPAKNAFNVSIFLLFLNI